jgi:hypothetical protein
MAKLDIDPVLEQLVHAVNESGQARVPVTVAAHGTLVSGVLIAQEAYFSALAEGSPLLSALQPASGLLALLLGGAGAFSVPGYPATTR